MKCDLCKTQDISEEAQNLGLTICWKCLEHRTPKAKEQR